MIMELTSHFNARLNHSSVVSSVFTEKENTFLTANRDGTITIVTFQPKFRQNSKRITHSEVTAMAYETNNYNNAKSSSFTNNQQCLHRIILGTAAGDLLILSNKLEIITTLHQKHFDRIVKIQFFDNNKYFLTASYDCSLKIFDARTYKYVSSFYDHQGWVTDFSISPNEKSFITACVDKKIRLFDIKKKRCVAIIGPFPFVPTAVLFHPGGKHYFIGFTNGVIACYKLKGAKKVLSVQLHQSSVTAISLHKSGAFLASVSVDSTISILEVEKATILFSMLVKQKGLNSVTFSNDGWQLMTTSISGRLTIWDFPFNGLMPKSSSGNSVDSGNENLIDTDTNSDENCFPEVLPRPNNSQTMPPNFQMQNNTSQNLIQNNGQFSYTHNPPNAVYIPQMVNQQKCNVEAIDPNLEKNPYEFSDSNSFTSVEAQQVDSNGELSPNKSSSNCVEVVKSDIIIEEEEEMETNSEDELISSEEGRLTNKIIGEEEDLSPNKKSKAEEEDEKCSTKNLKEEEIFSSSSFEQNEEIINSSGNFKEEEDITDAKTMKSHSSSFKEEEEIIIQNNKIQKEEEEEDKLSSSNSKNDENINDKKEEEEFSHNCNDLDEEEENGTNNYSTKIEKEEFNPTIHKFSDGKDESIGNNSLNEEGSDKNHRSQTSNDDKEEEEEEKSNEADKSTQNLNFSIEEEEEDSADNIQYIDTDEFSKNYSENKKEKKEEESNSIKADFINSSSLSSGHDETENKISRNNSENISLNNSTTDTFNEIVIEIKPSYTEESFSESAQDLLQNFSFTAPTVTTVETVSSTQNAFKMNKTESLTNSELYTTNSTTKSKIKSTDSHHDEIEDFNAAFTVHSSSINTESPVYDFNNYSDKECNSIHEEEEFRDNSILNNNTEEVNLSIHSNYNLNSKHSSSFPSLNIKEESQNQTFYSDPAQYISISNNNVFSYLYRSNNKSNESNNDNI